MLHGNRIITIRIHGITGIYFENYEGKTYYDEEKYYDQEENINLAFKGNI